MIATRLLAAALLAGATASAQTPAGIRDSATLADFSQRVQSYEELRRTVASSGPLLLVRDAIPVSAAPK